MNAFAAHFKFEFRTGIRNQSLLLMNYLLPLGFYLMMGLIMPQINPFFATVMVPAMVTFAVLVATLLGLPDPLVNAREAGIFRSYKINGVPKASILLFPALTTLVHMSIVSAIISFSAPLLFDATPPANWAGFILAFLILALACIGIGLLIGVVSSSSRMTVLYSQLIFLPSMLLGGMMMPYAMLPENIQRAARLLPATHGMNAFLGLAMGQTADFSAWLSVTVLITSGILAIAVTLALFTWDRHNVTHHFPKAIALLSWLPYAMSLFL